MNWMVKNEKLDRVARAFVAWGVGYVVMQVVLDMGNWSGRRLLGRQSPDLEGALVPS